MKKKESAKEYHESEYLGRSQIFKIKKSPEIFKFELGNPMEPTPALIFGQAFHKYMLELDSFSDEFIIAPNVDRRTKEGKEQWSKFVLQAEDKTVISIEDFEIIKAMSESVNNNKYARYLLTGEKEISYYWEDDLTKEKLKCRVDIRKDVDENTGIIADLKTCTSAAAEDFMRDIIKYGYDLQVAQYRTGVEQEEQKHHDFIFIAVEKTPPYAVNIMQADELIFKRGYDLLREYVGRIADCKQTGNWYGYNGFSGYINNIGLPPYILKEME